jgi:hypothetical protein
LTLTTNASVFAQYKYILIELQLQYLRNKELRK